MYKELLNYEIIIICRFKTSKLIDSTDEAKYLPVHSRSQFHQRSTYSCYAQGAQKHKKDKSSYQYLFTLLRSACIKAVRITLMKLSLDLPA